MYWVDNSFYKGAWVKGIQHGQGIMQLADGSVKKGTFENNIFIEEITEADESLESSMIENPHQLAENQAMILYTKKKGKGKKSKRKTKRSLLPHIDTHSQFADQSGRQFSSAKKPLMRNLSEAQIRKGGIIQFNSARKFTKSSNRKKKKNALSLPRIDSRGQESAVSSRLKGFTSVAKNQAVERKKLETYFKSLDRAVQILRNKRQSELSSRPWIPAGPVKQYVTRPSSKYG